MGPQMNSSNSPLQNMLQFHRKQSAYLALAAVSIAIVSLLVALGLVFLVYQEEDSENDDDSLYKVLNVLIVVGALGIVSLVVVYLRAIKDMDQNHGNNRSSDLYCWQPTGIVIDIADDAIFEYSRGHAREIRPNVNHGKSRLVQEVPMWAPPKYEDLQDSLPDYDQIKSKMERNKIEFLQHID